MLNLEKGRSGQPGMRGQETLRIESLGIFLAKLSLLQERRKEASRKKERRDILWPLERVHVQVIKMYMDSGAEKPEFRSVISGV